MVRVKATGETTEVDREVMKALRNEEGGKRSYGALTQLVEHQIRKTEKKGSHPPYFRWTQHPTKMSGHRRG